MRGASFEHAKGAGRGRRNSRSAKRIDRKTRLRTALAELSGATGSHLSGSRQTAMRLSSISAVPVTGRVIGKELTDELGDRVGLVIDGIDGRVHHVALGGVATADKARIGGMVEIGRASPTPRPADRNIAELAGGTGEYRPSQHRAVAEAGGVRVPGGDYDAYVESHVRRLEALRAPVSSNGSMPTAGEFRMSSRLAPKPTMRVRAAGRVCVSSPSTISTVR